MARRDWLLLALDAAGDRGLSPVQVQKSMFLFWKGAETILSEGEFYDFVPYNFGPFDLAIYNDIEAMERDGLVRILNRNATAERLYTIRSVGSMESKQVKHSDPITADYIGKVVRWVQAKPFPDLLRYIYRKWPEYRENSIFVG